MWEKIFDDLGAAFWIKYDAADEALYFTATTTHGGGTTSRSKGPPDGKLHPNCDHDTCAVTGRLSATDGTVHWLRTFQGSPRWGAFDQSGDVELAAEADGPYVYAAFDDAGENGAVTLDAGTPFAGCKAADGKVTPEYEISTSKLVAAADCPAGSTFVARTDPDAVPAAAAKTYALCGNKEAGMACIIKCLRPLRLSQTRTPLPANACMPLQSLSALHTSPTVPCLARPGTTSTPACLSGRGTPRWWRRWCPLPTASPS